MNDYWRNLIAWTTLWGCIPFILALFCEVLGGPVRWHIVPGLTFMMVFLPAISFDAGTKVQKLNRKMDNSC